MPNTWGISGPTFLLLYVVVAGAALAAALAGRAAALRGAGPLRLSETDPYLLAYLDGGAGRVVQAAAVALRVRGLIEPSAQPGRWVATPGALGHPPGGTPGDAAAGAVEGAVLDGVEAGLAYQQLTLHPPVVAQVAALHRRALDQGALRADDVRWRARAAAWPLALILALGLARLVAGIAGGRPVGWLALLLVAIAGTGAALLAVSRADPRLRRELAALRRRHAGRQRPADGADLARTALLGVALLGWSGVAGWELFSPEEEAQLALTRHVADPGSGGSSGWTGMSGDGGGGSDGGGGGSDGGGGGSDGGGDSGGSGGCGGGCGGCGG